MSFWLAGLGRHPGRVGIVTFVVLGRGPSDGGFLQGGDTIDCTVHAICVIAN